MPTLIPFNLEAAKAGAPLITRDGRPVKFIAHVPEVSNEECKVIVLINGKCRCDHFAESGKWVTCSESDVDLFMAPVTHKRWLNIYPDARTVLWALKEDADINADDDRIACIQITFTEGEGV